MGMSERECRERAPEKEWEGGGGDAERVRTRPPHTPAFTVPQV